ncbi:hypothetical protein Hte_010527 [Hypoxylon texense]
MYLFKSIIVAGIIIAGAAGTNQNLGCNSCLGQSADRINYGCRQSCDQAFNSASSEFESCYDTCHHFAFERHCCSGSCPGDANTCMNRFLPPAPKGSRRAIAAAPSPAEDRSHARDFAPAEPGDGAVMVRDDETGLVEVRVDVGSACCKAAQAILAASVTKVVPLLQGQIWDDDALAGLILIGFGLSAATACSKVFRVSCLFKAPGVQGNVAGGPLPGGNIL